MKGNAQDLFRMKRSSSPRKIGEYIEKWRKGKKGHFAVYSKEGKRFMVPLCFLNHPIFRVLLDMAEEEFGLTVRGPIKVPCEEELIDFILSLLRKKPCEEVGGINTCRGASMYSLFIAHNQGHVE